MSKTNGSRRRGPASEPRHTFWWAVVKILASKKLHRRCTEYVHLLGRIAITLVALAAVVLLVRGPDLAAVMHDLVAARVLPKVAG